MTTTVGDEVGATVEAGCVAVVGAGVSAAESTPAAGGKVAPGESVATTTSGDGVNGATGGPISKTWFDFPRGHGGGASQTWETSGGGRPVSACRRIFA